MGRTTRHALLFFIAVKLLIIGVILYEQVTVDQAFLLAEKNNDIPGMCDAMDRGLFAAMERGLFPTHLSSCP